MAILRRLEPNPADMLQHFANCLGAWIFCGDVIGQSGLCRNPRHFLSGQGHPLLQPDGPDFTTEGDFNFAAHGGLGQG